MRRLLLLLPVLMTVACGSHATLPAKDEINVAMAANLTLVFGELDQIFERQTGIHLVPSFGATTQLAQQIQALHLQLANVQEVITALEALLPH